MSGRRQPEARTGKAMKNALFGILSYGILILSNFVTRRVFILQLGDGLVGIESLFKSVVSMLSLAELGIGTGLVYLLYQPLAERDAAAIRRVLNFYRRAYLLISAVILAAGAAMSFFVWFFVEESYDPRFLGLTFFLYVLDTLAAYLFAHQRALIIADQKNYVNNLNEMLMNLLAMVLQVTLLLVIRSFVVYILVRIFCRLVAALLIHRNFRRLYPEIAASRSRESISREQRQGVMLNIRSMLFHKVGGLGVTASGSLIISKLLGSVVNGLYANYTLITTTVNALILQVFSGITASFGDYIHSENRAHACEKFDLLHYINFLIASFCTTSLFVLLEPFIALFFGPERVLPHLTTVLLTAHFFVYSMRRVVLMVRDSAGLYAPDRYMPLVEIALNVALSLVLVLYTPLGVNGVLIGNLVSMLLIPFWIQPRIVYRAVFGRSSAAYFGRYALYALCTVVGCLLTGFLAGRLSGLHMPALLALFLRACLCLTVPNLLNLLLFCRTKEFAGVKQLFLHIWKRRRS